MRAAAALVLALASVVTPLTAQAHCEIPCGIYNDELRIVMIQEDLKTIEKSMQMIEQIGQSKRPEWNQLVRWTTNKEEHAQKIQDIVTQYFLTQRIKAPAADDPKAVSTYNERLRLLHQLLVTAMKMKQSTDQAFVKLGRELTQSFAEAYFGPEDLKHLKKHHG